MRRIVAVSAISLGVLGMFGCAREELPPGTPMVTSETLPADDALPEEGFFAGWKAIPGSYLYSASPDELWKIYDGAAPGVISEGGREAATQGYENTEGGADRSLRVFILRFVARDHALAYLTREMEEAKNGEELLGVDAGRIFDRGRSPWARFVVGCYQVSINWEGSTEDAEDTTTRAVQTITAKLRPVAAGAG